MNPIVVVIADLTVDGFDELTDMIESSDVAELELEVAVERFLKPILPWTTFRAVGWLCAVALKQRFVRSRDVFTPLI